MVKPASPYKANRRLIYRCSLRDLLDVVVDGTMSSVVLLYTPLHSDNARMHRVSLYQLSNDSDGLLL